MLRLLLAGVALLLGLTALVVGLAAWLLAPSTKDLLSICFFLLASGGFSLVAALVAMDKSGNLLRTLRDKLLFALLFSAALVMVNVGFTAYLMFLSSHDLELLSLLMLFSVGMSAFFAIGISRSLQTRLRNVLDALRAVGSGQLNARAAVSGNDEIDEMARSFNAMADQLEAAFGRQQNLERARRNLVAAVSHDLRTPLATMRAMVESINDGVVSDAETVHRYLRNLQSEIEYLTRLIDDLFELSQIDAGLLELKMDSANLRDLISDTVEALSAQAVLRRLTLKGNVEESLPLVVIDAQRVQRVLYNLLQNAVRHTPSDGTIVIRAVDAGDEVQISVIDTGEGIVAEDLPRIFQRFGPGNGGSRTRTKGGSGLGLSIAKGIVELHGGRIWAESVEGHGATFTFALPKASGGRMPVSGSAGSHR